KYNDIYDGLEDTVHNSRYFFLGVPTPMNDDGSQDLSNVDDAIKSIVEVANSRKVIIIKTTILPGTCRKYAEMYPNHDFVHNPEFLTERRAKLEFINAPRIILGGEDHVTEEVERLYRTRFTHTPIYKTTWEGAEVAKYMANCFYAVKVSFMNEMYDVARHVGVKYNDLRDMLLASGWVNPMHTDVPGHDGERGYGGKCFPKDVKAFIHWARECGLGSDLVEAADKANERIRKEKDWLNIKGATSKNDYKSSK
ncbi:MAG: UDP-glucose/GDP-mannose dehydrogenase family protein, partial [Geobacter sp.]